jgi:hypothetical protein
MDGRECARPVHLSNPLTFPSLEVDALFTPFAPKMSLLRCRPFKLALLSTRTPLHASFSSTNDTVAFLWESGLVQVWDLQTRLGPGPGKIMNPTKVGEGIHLRWSRKARQRFCSCRWEGYPRDPWVEGERRSDVRRGLGGNIRGWE